MLNLCSFPYYKRLTTQRRVARKTMVPRPERAKRLLWLREW